MKINIGKIPIKISLDEPAPRVGDVYRGKGGGRGVGTAFWLVAAIGGNGCLHMLGLDRDGNIVSTVTYVASAMRRREVVGHVECLCALTLDMTWEAV